MIITPMTTQKRENIYHYMIEKCNFLKKKSYLNFSQIKVIDVNRLYKRLGKISSESFKDIIKRKTEVMYPRSLYESQSGKKNFCS